MDNGVLALSTHLSASKRIALKLHGLNWIDRHWGLQKLSPAIRVEVKKELAQLKKIGVTNALGLLAQLNLQQPQSEIISDSGVEIYGFSVALERQLTALLNCEQGPQQLRECIEQYLEQTNGSEPL